MSVFCSLRPLLLAVTCGVLQVSVAEFPYPPDAASGGTVAALLSLTSGAVTRVDILSGGEPFVSAASSALRGMRVAEDPGMERMLAVVNYREPGLFALGDPNQPVPAPTSVPASIPYPETVTQPAYPPNAAGEGAVILRVAISATGNVEKVETVKSQGILTESGLDALKSWTFTPARDSRGRPVASAAYIIFVFRAPVLTSPVLRH